MQSIDTDVGQLAAVTYVVFTYLDCSTDIPLLFTLLFAIIVLALFLPQAHASPPLVDLPLVPKFGILFGLTSSTFPFNILSAPFFLVDHFAIVVYLENR